MNLYLRFDFMVAVNYLTFTAHCADHVHRAGSGTGSKLAKIFANRFFVCSSTTETDSERNKCTRTVSIPEHVVSFCSTHCSGIKMGMYLRLKLVIVKAHLSQLAIRHATCAKITYHLSSGCCASDLCY